eukprot:6741534-Prymnesium_polylepis.1
MGRAGQHVAGQGAGSIEALRGGGYRRRAADGSACSGPSLPASAAGVIPSLFARPVDLRARRYGPGPRRLDILITA